MGNNCTKFYSCFSVLNEELIEYIEYKVEEDLKAKILDDEIFKILLVKKICESSLFSSEVEQKVNDRINKLK